MSYKQWTVTWPLEFATIVFRRDKSQSAFMVGYLVVGWHHPDFHEGSSLHFGTISYPPFQTPANIPTKTLHAQDGQLKPSQAGKERLSFLTALLCRSLMGSSDSLGYFGVVISEYSATFGPRLIMFVWSVSCSDVGRSSVVKYKWRPNLDNFHQLAFSNIWPAFLTDLK